MAVYDRDHDLLRVLSDAYNEFLESRNPGMTAGRWEMSRDWWDRIAATIPHGDDDPPPEPAEGDLLFGWPITVTVDGPPRVVAEQQ